MGRTLFANPANRGGRGRRAAWLAPLVVLALWAADAKAQSNVLVSNIGQPTVGSIDLDSYDLAQKFTTGANAGGYTLTSVEIRLVALTSQGGDSAAPWVRLVRAGAAESGSVEAVPLTAETATIAADGGPTTPSRRRRTSRCSRRRTTGWWSKRHAEGATT